MATWYEVIAMFDLIDRIEGVVSSFVQADWKGAAKAGPAGVAGELARTITGANRWRIYVSRRVGWSGPDIERFLNKYGVVIWDRGFAGDDYYFCVKERQANWAEYLLQRRGIPVHSNPFNPKNVQHGARFAPGNSPPAWADKGRPSIGDVPHEIRIDTWNDFDQS